MSVKIIKKTLKNDNFTFNAMAFLPSESEDWRRECALFTHGYTASKSDCINWAQRLSEAGIPCVIFDLPGHHLGSYNSVSSFQTFKARSHYCFVDALNFLKDYLPSPPDKLILGGHSLGALLSIKALELAEFKDYDRLAIAVGLGISQHKTIHLFESSFYQKTLNIRRQLVDENLDAALVFPWIHEEKLNLSISGQRIHLITGQDDVVIGAGGSEALRFHLEEENNVTMFEPKKLPHHEPSLAATHIYSFLKKELHL